MAVGGGPAERLQSWLDDIQLSNQLGVPQYANPGELKADLRVLLSERRALREGQAHHRGEQRRSADRLREALDRAEKAEEALRQYESIGRDPHCDCGTCKAYQRVREALRQFQEERGEA